MAKVDRSTKKILNDFLECKFKGMCDRDSLVTEWARGRMETNDVIRRTVIEIMREKADLPLCPPICPQPEPDPEPEPDCECAPDPSCVDGEYTEVETKAEVLDKML